MRVPASVRRSADATSRHTAAWQRLTIAASPLGPGRPEMPNDSARRSNLEDRPHDAADPHVDVDAQVDDEVHGASLESFPASDPPAWIGMRLGQPRRERTGEARP